MFPLMPSKGAKKGQQIMLHPLESHDLNAKPEGRVEFLMIGRAGKASEPPKEALRSGDTIVRHMETKVI